MFDFFESPILNSLFGPPAAGRIAVMFINHLGDEVLNVYGEKDWK